MNLSVVSLGTNKGNRARNLFKAVDLLSRYPKIDREAVSSVYKSAPLYDNDQPFFYNAAAMFQTSLCARVFFQVTKDVEERIGKDKEREKGPRRIDLDILFFGGSIMSSDDLVIPHPGIQERLFVLKPLMEILPFFVHPVLKKNIRELYFDLKTDDKVEYKMQFEIEK